MPSEQSWSYLTQFEYERREEIWQPMSMLLIMKKSIYVVMKVVTTNVCRREANIIIEIINREDGITDEKLFARLGKVSIRLMRALKASDWNVRNTHAAVRAI